ncbi:MAG: peptidoglycan-binding protein [Oscillospiraceae bacterium]|nr:peptidoglycan-binding protein [Oscillospiraceae bacterium]
MNRYDLCRALDTAAANDPRLMPVSSCDDEHIRAALMIFQQEHHLPATGKADIITLKKLCGVCTPLPLAAAAYRYPLHLGSSGSAVMILQAMLDRLSDEYENLFRPVTNGIYDIPTQNDIMLIQSACGIYPNGCTDIITWNTITTLFNALIQQ